MATKATPTTAIRTVAPLESLRVAICYIANVSDPSEIPGYRKPNHRSLAHYIKTLGDFDAPSYIFQECLAGRITSAEDMQVAMLTARLMGRSEEPGIVSGYPPNGPYVLAPSGKKKPFAKPLSNNLLSDL